MAEIGDAKHEPNMVKVKTMETMWAEAKPDLYDGETCDQLRPRWYTHCTGYEGEYHGDDRCDLQPFWSDENVS